MGLEHRAKLDENSKLLQFCRSLREAISYTVDKEGKMTKDMAMSIPSLDKSDYLETEKFMNAIQVNLIKIWNQSKL